VSIPAGKCYCRYDADFNTWALAEDSCRQALYTRCQVGGQACPLHTSLSCSTHTTCQHVAHGWQACLVVCTAVLTHTPVAFAPARFVQQQHPIGSKGCRRVRQYRSPQQQWHAACCSRYG
jgi:hypothetical protein